MTNSAPPTLWFALFAFVVTSRKIGSSRLTTSARRCLRNTRKSARNKEEKTIRSDGAAGVSRLVTDFASRQSDEHILEGHIPVGDLTDPWIVLVLLDQVMRRLRGQQLAVVDHGNPIAPRLGLLHRMRRQQNAPPVPAQVLDPTPQLTPRLRIQTRSRLVEQQQRGLVDHGDLQGQSLLLSAGQLLEGLIGLSLESHVLEPFRDLVIREPHPVQPGVQMNDLGD